LVGTVAVTVLVDETKEKCPVCGKTEASVVNQAGGEYFLVCKNCGCNFWSPQLKSIQSLNIRAENVKKQKEELEAEIERQRLLIEEEVNGQLKGAHEEKYMRRETTRVIPKIVVEKLETLHRITRIPEDKLQEMYERAFFGSPEMLEPLEALRHKAAIAMVWQTLSENPSNKVKSDNEYASLQRAFARHFEDLTHGKIAASVELLSQEDTKAEREGYTLSSEDHTDKEKDVQILKKLKEKFKKKEVSREVFEALTEKYEEDLADLSYEEDEEE